MMNDEAGDRDLSSAQMVAAGSIVPQYWELTGMLKDAFEIKVWLPYYCCKMKQDVEGADAAHKHTKCKLSLEPNCLGCEWALTALTIDFWLEWP